MPAPKRSLYDDDDGSSDHEGHGQDFAIDLSVNRDFAEKYNKKKQTEELSKLQDKYGKNVTLSDMDSDSDESLSDDDSDAELVTPAVDAAILRTLAKIKNKDPTVYEQGRQVFDEEETTIGQAGTSAAMAKRTKASKPVLLKDYQRQRVLADPTLSQPDSAPDASFTPLTHAQEEEALRREVKQAFLGSTRASDDDADEDEDEDDLLVRRDKSKDELDQEEQEYAEFLRKNAGGKAVEDALAAEDRFLREYILNRGWIDREANNNRIPSYQEITGDDDGQPSRKKKKTSKTTAEKFADAADDDGHLLDPGLHDSEESDFEEKADDFEYRYNFRFEDPEGTQMVTHARNAVSTVRKPTAAVSARARARESAKERKEAEKQARREEVRRLKALKRKEVEDKLLQLVETAGEGTKGLENIDLEGDWDPEEHDRRMAEVYGEEYGAMEDADFKPTWDDDIDIADIVGEDGGEDDGDDAAMSLPFKVGSGMDAPGMDDIMEAEIDNEEPSQKDKKRKDKKRKRDEEGFPSELMDAARAGADDDQRQMLDKLEDEYYGIEYEDKIGDMPTRFKYAKVAPQDFSLTPTEILLATDAELNAYMSLKKLAPYRSDADAVKRNKKKLKELREILKNRKWGEEVTDEWTAGTHKDKKKKNKNKNKSHGGAGGESAGATEGVAESATKKKRPGKGERKKRKALAAQNGGEGDAVIGVEV